MLRAENSIKNDEICPLAFPNQISLISIHISSLVKIPWYLLKLLSGNENMGVSRADITATHLFKYIENLTTKKKENFQIRKSDIFHISAQNMDCGHSLEPPRRGGSNEYPQSMFLSRNKKNNVYPCKPQFYYIKGVEGGQNYIGVFS